MSDPESGRLSSWSRRKLDAKRQEETVEPTPDLPDTPDDVEDNPELIAALPSLDEITADFDITPFLAKGIPAHLKNAALRKLWGASPAVRDYLDPAVDYAWDWNAPGGVPGGGGVLSEQSIAKMVKDIIGTRPDDADAALTDDAAPDELAPVEIPQEPDVEPVAVRHAPELIQEPDTAPKAEHAAKLPLRRHGGAVPE